MKILKKMNIEIDNLINKTYIRDEYTEVEVKSGDTLSISEGIELIYGKDVLIDGGSSIMKSQQKANFYNVRANITQLRASISDYDESLILERLLKEEIEKKNPMLLNNIKIYGDSIYLIPNIGNSELKRNFLLGYFKSNKPSISAFQLPSIPIDINYALNGEISETMQNKINIQVYNYWFEGNNHENSKFMLMEKPPKILEKKFKKLDGIKLKGLNPLSEVQSELIKEEHLINEALSKELVSFYTDEEFKNIIDKLVEDNLKLYMNNNKELELKQEK